METVVKNGSNGNTLKIDDYGRALTLSVSESISEAGGRLGDTYNVNTGLINLTNSSKSAVLYFENNDVRDVEISIIGFLLGNSTGGSGDMNLDVDLNVTSGTIISTATPTQIYSNKNAGSKKSITSNAYKGFQGATASGGIGAYTSLLNSATRQYAISTGLIVLPKGSNMCVYVTPQTGNTSMNCEVFLSVIHSLE